LRRIDIDALRTALGLTQAQLAVAIGMSERTVQNWEAGRVSPQAERRLRDLLELDGWISFGGLRDGQSRPI
jgi:DNA-binding transcriptional regulator YiaG